MKYISTNLICLTMLILLSGSAFTDEKEKISEEEDYIKRNLKTDVIYETNNNMENGNRIKNFIVGIWENGEGGYRLALKRMAE